MDYSIGLTEAIYLLRTYSMAERLPIAKHPEITAIITHWLQNPDSIPIYGTAEIASSWRRLLVAHSFALTTPLQGNNWPQPKANQKPLIKFDGVPFPPPAKAKFTFAEICAGIGGFRIPLQRAGGRCVFSSEIDNAARQTYFENYGEYPFGDVRQFTERVTDEQIDGLVPDHDVLAAGFPCQPFSKAGVSARNHLGQESGFDCEIQGTIFFDIKRIAEVKRPAVLLLENVKNLLNHDDGKTFAVIRRALEDDLRYSFASQILDASSLVPQRRERCYIVCFRKRRTKFSFPRFDKKQLRLKSILEKDPDERFTISNKLWDGHKKRSKRNRARNTGFVVATADINKPANTLIARYGKDGKECLIPQEGKNPRLLLPRECARLQGFPEEFILPEQDTAAYHQLGNAVAVPVVEKIVKKVITKILTNSPRNS
jgi:DNA (cytosine-5)-methyltransferase 1